MPQCDRSFWPSSRLIAYLLGCVLWLITSAGSAAAVDVYLFWRAGCPHCNRAIAFVEHLAADEPAIRLHKFEISRDRDNVQLMVNVTKALQVESSSVPLTVIGDRVWVGYLDDASTGREWRERINECLREGCRDSVTQVRAGASVDAPIRVAGANKRPEMLHVPLFGEIRTANLSLPVLTVVLAAVDGFNPCALWVLLFLLGLIAGIQDRMRMWILGATFVAASALVYLLILAAWLNVMLFVGALAPVRIAIGLIALAGGGYYLRSFVTNRDPICTVTAPQHRRRVLERLKELAQQRDFALALGGIVLLAFAVNSIEFLCSAGIPAVFMQVLALSSLPSWQYASYLVLYVAVFMLDDLVVLIAALKTLEITGLTTRYVRWSNLMGAVVLLAIGALLILRPDWLTFM